MWAIKAGNHEMLLKKANTEDPNQTVFSDLGLHCCSRALLSLIFQHFTHLKIAIQSLIGWSKCMVHGLKIKIKFSRLCK